MNTINVDVVEIYNFRQVGKKLVVLKCPHKVMPKTGGILATDDGILLKIHSVAFDSHSDRAKDRWPCFIDDDKDKLKIGMVLSLDEYITI